MKKQELAGLLTEDLINLHFEGRPNMRRHIEAKLTEWLKLYPDEIIVTVRGGLVQDVGGVPAGVTVLVRDYDVDGDDPAERGLDKDAEGHYYCEAIWN